MPNDAAAKGETAEGTAGWVRPFSWAAGEQSADCHPTVWMKSYLLLYGRRAARARTPLRVIIYKVSRFFNRLFLIFRRKT
jgi:hypothetical protein